MCIKILFNCLLHIRYFKDTFFLPNFGEVLFIDVQWKIWFLIEFGAKLIYVSRLSLRHSGAANRLPPLLPHPFKRLVGREGDLPWWRLLLCEKVGFAREIHCFYYFKRRIMEFRATNVAKRRNKPLRYLLIIIKLLISAVICTINTYSFVSIFMFQYFIALLLKNIFINS